MRGKQKLIILGSMLILIIMFSMIYFLLPTIEIKINGEENLTINIGENYKDKGAVAYVKRMFSSQTIDLKTIGEVDTSKIGEYIITYKAENKSQQKSAIRIVSVVDNVKPKIILKEEIKVCKENNLIEINATAMDNYDGNISDNIKYKIEEDKIYITVSDSSNNSVKIEKKFNYIDDEKPLLTLNGGNEIYLYTGENYEELGANAYDSCEGDITNRIKIEGNVDVNKPGIYPIKYKIKDNLGNETIQNRNVIVKEYDNNFENKNLIINGARIYLTFDDGPGPYTEQILDILNKYNVKATFFVTNQFPDYQYLIKKEHEQGHAIGMHTYSHKWSIYESVDSYLEDFKRIEEIIFRETGIHPNIFRFPGGSSNKVSINYSRGIMTKLAKIMTEYGYTYFDWTFDSGDTSKNDSSTKTIINNVKSNLKGDGDYIILMHDIKKNTLEALPEIIEYAKFYGYTFETLNETSPTTHFKIAN